MTKRQRSLMQQVWERCREVDPGNAFIWDKDFIERVATMVLGVRHPGAKRPYDLIIVRDFRDGSYSVHMFERGHKLSACLKKVMDERA